MGLLDSYGSIKDVVDSIYSSLPPENYGYEGEEYDFADEQELQEALEEESTEKKDDDF